MTFPSRLAVFAAAAALAGCGGSGDPSGGSSGSHKIEFQIPTSILISLIPVETLRLDANFDGIDDVAVIGLGASPGASQRIEVRLGRRGGGLDPTPSFTDTLLPTAAISLVPRAQVVDSDGDGDDDIVFTFRSAFPSGVNEVWEYASNRDGTFTRRMHFNPLGGALPVFHGPVTLATVLDADQNSLHDLALVYGQTVVPGGTWRLALYLRDIVGDLNLAGSFQTLPAEPVRLLHGDIDGNGTEEVIVEYGPNRQSDTYNTASGVLTPYIAIPTLAGDVGHGLAVGDLDGDIFADIVTTPALGGPPALEYDSTFLLSRQPTVPDIVGEKALPLIGDLSNDGIADLVVAIRAIGPVDSLFAYQGNGDRSFVATTASVPINGSLIGTSLLTGALADVNGDGRLDLVHTEYGVVIGTYVLRVTLQQ